MDKVQAVHDYSESLNAMIQSTIRPTEDDMDVHVPSIYKLNQSHISHLIKEPLSQPGSILLP